jgi:hypothetical protein
MNKILSQALKKAVSEYSPEVIEVPKGNRPDLFSLNNETELFQNDKGIIIKIDRSRDANLTDFGKATLKTDILVTMNLFKIYLHVLQVHMQMTIYMHKEFIIT